MLFFERELICHNPACSALFYATECVRLHCESEHAKKYNYQDLIRGTCPYCLAVVYAWMGVDFKERLDGYNPISPKKHAKWDERSVYEKVVQKQTGCDTVNGSESQFPWRFLQNIPVY